MSSRGGRGRFRRDFPGRSEEKSHHGRGNNPPSRHLWVGNISHSLNESALAHLFSQFGELETVAFQSGRSFAFINYRNDKEAFAAIKELQGFSVGGNPLRIEFAKADKSSLPPRDAEYSQRRDEPHLMARGSPFPHRDSRAHHSSPDPPYLNKSKINDKDGEPSEVLWIGFPAQLKVDEFILRKAFSPFGEIEKITSFPGRTYAFVRFRNVMAACRAKETLEGKLFGNPRVHICFAKNESGPSIRERNAPPSPHGRPGSSEHFQSHRNFGVLSAPYIPNSGPGDPDMMGSARYDPYEQRMFTGQGSELGLPGNIYEHHNSPSRDISARFQEFSPKKFPRQGPFYDDDPWDLPEDVSFLHGTKKLKTGPLTHESELPEYPLSDLQKVKRVPSREIPPQSGGFGKNLDLRPSGYRPIPDRSTQPLEERGDHWRNTSHDNYEVESVQLPPRVLRESSSKEVWKWEGVIAKGGTSVCRARCFPVGKPPDLVLPEYLDCTARTSLDMLAKHYYQAASAWVIFFVPANDPDIAYYNEFMNFLGEKQRAAVVKLDERTTLFLVPPSEFSEKVLKVPGKLSMSGVVLRLDPHGSSVHDNQQTSFTSDAAAFYQKKPISPSGPYFPTPMNYDHKPAPPFPENFSSGAFHSMSNNITQSVNAQGHDYYLQKPNWSTHDWPQNPNNTSSSIGSAGPTYSSATSNNYTSGIPAEQLAQLASSLLGQQGGQSSATGEYRLSDQSGYPFKMSQNSGIRNAEVSSEFPQGQFGQQQSSNMFSVPQREDVQGAPQQLQNGGQENVAEGGDPQKRLQATLQLAASLLQQIQQGKGN